MSQTQRKTIRLLLKRRRACALQIPRKMIRWPDAPSGEGRRGTLP